MDNKWREVTYRRAKCLVFEGTPKSIKKEGFPFVYWLRHSESDWSEPSTVERVVWFNRWGVLLSSREIDLGEADCINLSPKIRERFRRAADGTHI